MMMQGKATVGAVLCRGSTGSSNPPDPLAGNPVASSVMDKTKAFAEMQQLDRWLEEHSPRDLLMALVRFKKRPTIAHKGGKWTRSMFQAKTINDFKGDICVGMLARDMIIVDFDSVELFQYLQNGHSEFKLGESVRVKTQKGYHVYFSRTEECIDIKDRARSIRPSSVPAELLDHNGEVPLDIKTVASTGTAGVVVVPPSAQKEWILAPWDGEILPIPSGLVQWIQDNQKHSKSRAIVERDGGSTSDPRYNGDWALAPELELRTAIELGYTSLANCNPPDTTSQFYEQKGNRLYFKTGNHRRTCPSRTEHDSNNLELHFKSNGTIMQHCFGGKCKYVQIGQWYHRAKQGRFDERYYNELNIPYKQELQKKPEEQEMYKHTPVLDDYLNDYFIVVKSSKPEVIELAYDTEGERVVSYIRRSMDQHKKLYKHKYMPEWVNGSERRSVHRLVQQFDPKLVNEEEEFNMFLGLGIELRHDKHLLGANPDMAVVQPFLDLIFDVWSSKDGALFNYLIDWFAYLLQPRHKTGTIVVVISPQGFGKGTIEHHLIGCGIYREDLEGKYGVYNQIADIDDIVGRFNSQSCNCMFINADECSSFGGAYKQNNKLKNLVTSTTRKLENKGLDPVKINAFTTYLFTTNSDKPVKVELSDRRFVIVDIPHENKPDHDTFKRLH